MDTQDLILPCRLDKYQFFKIHKFKIEDHFSYIEEWLKKRNLSPWPKEELPKIGYIISYDYIPKAAAFIRRCEGDIGLFDSLIADPDFEFEKRDGCIDFLVDYVLFEARRYDFKKIIAYSINARTLERSKKHGFIEQSHKIISIIL